MLRFALPLLCLAAPAMAEMHEVRMLNRNDTGPMAYEPDHLSIAPGDTVKFLATSKGHNAASIDGMLPEGAQPFKGQINEEIKVTFDSPGRYGVKCSPHFAMGMVMLIDVGEASSPALPADLPPRAEKRFGEILARAGESRG